MVYYLSTKNSQKVQEGQGILSLLSVQADQQYHAVQQYPEVQEYQQIPARRNRGLEIRHKEAGKKNGQRTIHLG